MLVVTHSMMVQRDASSAATKQEEGLFTNTPSSSVVYSFQIVEGVSRCTVRFPELFLALCSLCQSAGLHAGPHWAFYA